VRDQVFGGITKWGGKKNIELQKLNTMTNIKMKIK